MKHTTLFLALAFFLALNGMAQVSVLTYHNDNYRTGANTNETLLTPANVTPATFGKLFKYDVDGYIYAQPLYVPNLAIPGKGTHNVLFIATEHCTVYALDADGTNGPAAGYLWQTNLGPAAPTPDPAFGTRYNNNTYTDINPEVGITGTPVIDPVSGTLYVDTFNHYVGLGYFHKIHALNIADGTERPFSPVTVSASCPGTGVDNVSGVITFKAQQQIQRAALTLAGGRLYVAYAGYADTDPYHGWILGYDAATLQLTSNYIFNTSPNANTAIFGANAGEAGIWMSGNGLAVDAQNNIYFEVANGSFSATNGSGGIDYGDSVMKLSTTNGLHVVDYFTPYNQATIGGFGGDTDLGSGGLILLPDQPGPYPHLVIVGGKEGKVYLLDRDQFTTNNTHYNATGTTDPVLQTLPAANAGRSTGTPAYFNGWIYYGVWYTSAQPIKAFSVGPGSLSTTAVSAGTRTYSFPGCTPSISANGTTNGILWAMKPSNPGILVAHNATNLASEIYASSTMPSRDALTNGIKFAVPTVANGKVYAGSQYGVYVYGLLGDSYKIWKFNHFGGDANNNTITDDLADPDGDKIPNLMEFAMASNPNASGSEANITGAIAGNHFQFETRRNVAGTNLTFIAQAGSTLGTWSNLMTYTAATGWVANTPGATASESAVTEEAPDAFVNVTITDPAVIGTPGAANRFYRLVVHR